MVTIINTLRKIIITISLFFFFINGNRSAHLADCNNHICYKAWGIFVVVFQIEKQPFAAVGADVLHEWCDMFIQLLSLTCCLCYKHHSIWYHTDSDSLFPSRYPSLGLLLLCAGQVQGRLDFWFFLSSYHNHFHTVLCCQREDKKFIAWTTANILAWQQWGEESSSTILQQDEQGACKHPTSLSDLPDYCYCYYFK